jgi:adenosylcobinamide-GDP ribazoletransferase
MATLNRERPARPATAAPDRNAHTPMSALGACSQAMRGALGLLTVIPVGAAAEGPTAKIATGAPAFPLVGALIGALAGIDFMGARALFGAGPATVFAIATMAALSGGLHQDGLADCADALGVRGCREQRLAVMRQSTIGAYGALALIGWSLLAYAALRALPTRQVLIALVLAGALSRSAAVLHARITPPAREDGLGAWFAPSASATILAACLAPAIAFAPLAPGRAAIVIASSLLCALLLSALARRTLGGRTGDTLGATVALCELCVLLALAATIHH